jgi:glycine oxidase
LWDGDEAQVDNRALGIALANAFVRAGGKLSSNEAAVRIETEGGYRAVRTPFGLYYGDNVLIAAGAWSSGIEIDTPVLPPARPVKGEMLALTPPPKRDSTLPSRMRRRTGCWIAPLRSCRRSHRGLWTSIGRGCDPVRPMTFPSSARRA